MLVPLTVGLAALWAAAAPRFFVLAEEPIHTHGSVLLLTEQIFEEKINNVPLMLVDFYVPWCTHCKDLAPVYQQAAKTLEDEYEEGTGLLAAVDCTVSEHLCQARQISGFPTLILYRNGVAFDVYNGQRSAAALVKYMVEHGRLAKRERLIGGGISYVTALTQETFDAQLKDREIAMVLFMVPWCVYCNAMKFDYHTAGEELTVLHKASQAMYTVDCVAQRTLCAEKDIVSYPTLRVYANGAHLHTYHGGRNTDSIEAHMLPLLGLPGSSDQSSDSKRKLVVARLNSETAHDWLADKDRAVVFFYDPWCTYCQSLRPIFREAAHFVANSYGTTGMFAEIDCRESTEMCTAQGVTRTPTLLLFRQGHSVLRHNGPTSAMRLVLFATSPQPKGVIWSGMSSQDQPPLQVQPVLTLTTKMAKETLESAKIAVVLFCAVAQKACQDTLAAYKVAAMQLQQEGKEILTAHVDCDAEKTLCQSYEEMPVPSVAILLSNIFGKSIGLPATTNEIISLAHLYTSATNSKTGTEAEAIGWPHRPQPGQARERVNVAVMAVANNGESENTHGKHMEL